MTPRYLLLLLFAAWVCGLWASDTPPVRGAGSSSAVRSAPVPPPLSRAAADPFVRVDPSRALGSATAAVAIVEFADYQCPYCRGFHVAVLPELHKRFIETGKVRYFYMDFPLPSHKHALGASVAAYCAGAQGRYWEMQELLYAEQARLGAELYAELATELRLDLTRFKSCLGSNSSRRRIQADLAEGRRLGITGTPSFALGHIEQDRVTIKRQATGTPELEQFAREIEALLR